MLPRLCMPGVTVSYLILASVTLKQSSYWLELSRINHSLSARACFVCHGYDLAISLIRFMH